MPFYGLAAASLRDGEFFSSLSGLIFFFTKNPALKRWAIFKATAPSQNR